MIEPCEEVKRVEQRYEKALDDMEKHYKDVLDKIQTEVADVQLIGYAMINGKREIASKAVMEIIDKYR